MTAKEFRKKPVVISAVQWTGDNLREIITFTDGPPETRSVHAGMAWETYEHLVRRDGLKIFTLEGKMSADIGDWIIKGVKGEHYPCKPDIFAATYEAATGKEVMPDERSSGHSAVATSPGVTAGAVGTYQNRVDAWMDACFGASIKADRLERCDRFIEEALELVQTEQAFTADRAHALVDYVFGRDVGDPRQEVGGVMVTLAALCNTLDLGVEDAAEAELARVWTKVEAIRAKQAAKPAGSALPVATPPTALDDPRVRKLVEAAKRMADAVLCSCDFDSHSSEFARRYADTITALRDMEGV